MRARLADMPPESFDSCISDPPYGIAIGGAKWDNDIAFQRETWEAVRRVCKPAAFVAAFSSARTFHRTAVAMEDAGLEIMTLFGWITPDGFPASQDIGKRGGNSDLHDVKTALKPAMEPVIFGRVPLPKDAGGIIKYSAANGGRGAYHIRKCRIPNPPSLQRKKEAHIKKYQGREMNGGGCISVLKRGDKYYDDPTMLDGMYPANAAADDSPFVRCAFPDRAAGWSSAAILYTRKVFNGGAPGWSAKYTYCERTMGGEVENDHPTVKPINLMAHLCNLLTPDGGRILDPFCGSGSTLIAAELCGYESVGIDMSAHFCDIARQRIKAAIKQSAGRDWKKEGELKPTLAL